MSRKTKVNKLLEALNEGVFEKEVAIRLSLLASIAGESIFFLGLPGVAKSLIARRLKFAFKDARSFEYLMNRFSTPDEVFGPISVTELQKDNYKRIVENYLPDAEIVFLDEIWKAGPAIQNTLLTVLNEKVFRNGREEIKVKLKGLISASNELPAENDGHSDSVEALWDRFLLRLVVEGIEDETNFNSMISDDLQPTVDNVSNDLKITDEDYQKWNKEIDNVKIPVEVFKVIDVIRKKVQEYNDKAKKDVKEIYISDRRWRKIVRILRTSAFLNDRDEVDLMDCFLIAHCIWSEESEIQTTQEIVAESIRSYGYNLTIDIESIKNQIKELNKDVKKESEYEKPYEEVVYKVYNKDFYKLLGLTQYPQYSWIKKEDFKKINSTHQNFYFYDAAGVHSVNWTVYKDSDGIKVAEHNWSACKAETEKVTRKELKTRRPDRRLIEAFDKDVATIIAEIERQILIIETHRKDKLDHLQTNAFVDKGYSTIVEENLHNSVQELQNLRLDAEKIKAYYDELK